MKNWYKSLISVRREVVGCGIDSATIHVLLIMAATARHCLQ